MSDFSAMSVAGDGRRDLALDVFAPDRPNGVAAILLHGGGWAMGHRATMHGYARLLAAADVTAVAAEYRLLGEAPFPAQLDDVRDAVRWVKANAGELGVDPAKVALIGFSAGAHLALLAAGTQDGSGHERALGDPGGAEVAAVVSFFAPARLDVAPAALERPPLSALVAGGGVARAREISPIHYVNPNFPTTFIVGGMADYMQPLAAGLDLLNAFVAAGAEVEFHYLHSQVHEFPSTPGMSPGVMDSVAFFLRRTLLDRETLAVEAREQNPFARASSPEEFGRMMAGAPR
ncbi:alpha/beta hydrolase [Sphingomonas adhaesiva]|uniref:alpha/beta hydrolase n=1 Tax=Sphingomonas adhaesiva TaxID=28212 RepID=UPI002FF884CF